MIEPFELMLVLAIVMMIAAACGPQGLSYLARLVKSKLTQSHKIKTEATVSGSQDS